MLWISLALTGASLWFMILVLPWLPWTTREFLDAAPAPPQKNLSDLTVLIPARDEGEVIQTALDGLKGQGEGLSILLVDDQSTDETVRKAADMGLGNLVVLPGVSPPPGWSGKPWALQQGYCRVNTPLTFLMDADISLAPGFLKTIRKAMEEKGVHFLSLMAALRMTNFWERLLMPAFIYFFKLLYPFRLSNSSRFGSIAAAAGGCILLRTEVLDRLGGFEALRGELIDDCALAEKVKSVGYKTWIGLTHSARSLRPYNSLPTIWSMVSRTAYSQLRHSTLQLLLCTIIMAALFFLPVAGLAFPSGLAKVISTAALLAMVCTYIPTLRFYRLPISWALALPIIGCLFLAMTWTSAVRHWLGKGAEWKGRSYGRGKEI